MSRGIEISRMTDDQPPERIDAKEARVFQMVMNASDVAHKSSISLLFQKRMTVLRIKNDALAIRRDSYGRRVLQTRRPGEWTEAAFKTSSRRRDHVNGSLSMIRQRDAASRCAGHPLITIFRRARAIDGILKGAGDLGPAQPNGVA